MDKEKSVIWTTPPGLQQGQERKVQIFSYSHKKIDIKKCIC